VADGVPLEYSIASLTQLWSLDVDAAVQRVCAMTSNVLNRTVWRQDLPNVPYTAPCAHPGHDGRLEP
jgi:hypothetical protein